MKLLKLFDPIKYIFYILILFDVYFSSNWGLAIAFAFVFSFFELIFLVCRFIYTYVQLLVTLNEENVYKMIVSITGKDIQEMKFLEGVAFSLIKEIEIKRYNNRKDG